MNQQEIINRATLFVKDILKNDVTGHDFDHVIRVKEKAMYLQRHEGGDIFIISLASLLHDVDDHKLFPNHQHLENATSFLDAEDISEETHEKDAQNNADSSIQIFKDFVAKSFHDSQTSFKELLEKITNLDGIPEDIAKGKIVYKASYINHNRKGVLLLIFINI